MFENRLQNSLHRPAVTLLAILPVVVALTAAPACADDAELPLHVQIDRLIAAGTPDYESQAVPLASDAEFLRRVSLDLTGQIPTTDATRAFLTDDDPEKREKLVDRLLDSPEYARHMQNVYDVMLMRRLRAQKVSEADWQTFLRTSFAENKSWDQITREILSADGTDAKKRGPARFYLDRDGEANEITRDVGRIFLGVNLECAQCHDHPEVYDWKQEHYYGISAFLIRTFVFTDKQKKAMLAEKAEGEVTFQSVFEPADKKKGGKTTLPKLFDGPVLEEPKFKEGEEYEVKPDKDVRPIPKFSRLAKLPAAIIEGSDGRFARTAANRLWAQMMGRGLIHPVDYDYSLNPPSHPELLDLLAQQFEAQGYDIKWMLRELALTKTYQRSSRQAVAPESENIAAAANDEIVDAEALAEAAESAEPEEKSVEELPEEAFGQAMLKPLSPSQFAWAVLQATGEADVQRKALGDKFTEAALHQKLTGIENRFIQLFGGLPGSPPEEFESTVDQVLFLANDATVLGLIRPKNGNLADRLNKLPEDDAKALADELFLSVLTREPTEEEVAGVQNYLSGLSANAHADGIQELIWALLASSEFRFNH
jgi:hypothetical protein